MEKRKFGSTGLEVTPIGLGLAALGRPGYINLGHAEDLNRNYDVAEMERHSHQVLDAAWAGGVRYFDAARSYGRAEAFLGSWLRSRRINADEVVVGSKWGYIYTAGWRVDAEKHEVKEHSLEVLRQQRKESDELLGEHLDIYQVHSATLESGILKNNEVLGELARYREQGLVIGLSLSGPRQGETLEKALEVRPDGRLLFTSVQATWNLLERSAGPALAAACEAGMGVIVKEALANGRLTSRNQDPEFARSRELLERLAREQNTSIDALALRAVIAQPWAHVVLSGATTVDQLQSNLQALGVRWSDDLAGELQTLVEPPEAYWKTRGELEWN